MSEEKDLEDSELFETGENDYDDNLDDISNLVDFSNLDGLSDLSDKDVFGGLGDVEDLGELPKFSSLTSDTSDSQADDMFNDNDTPSGDTELDNLETDDEVKLNDDLFSKEGDDLLSLQDIDIDAIADGALDIDISGSDAEENKESDKPVLDDSVEDLDSQAEELDSMLDGLLNDLDMNGTIEENGDMDISEVESPDMALTEDVPDIALPDDVPDIALTEDVPDVALTDDIPDIALTEDGDMNDVDDIALTDDIPDMAFADENQDDVADLLGLDDSSFLDGGAPQNEDESMDMVSALIPDEEKSEEKKPGFFKRVFGNIVTDEIAEKERAEAKQAEEDAEKQAEEDAKLKEEKAAKKAEKEAEKEAKKAEKQKLKEAKKAEKAAKKAEAKAAREEEEAKELEVVGKLNKVGVSIIVIATILFLAFEITGTNIFSYVSAKKEAMNYFEMGKYTEAYKSAIGTDMRNKDKEDYQKIKTVMKVQQCLNAYQNYDRMKYYPEALDALIRGLKRYDANIEQATQLEVDKDLAGCRSQIISLLNSEFGMSEQQAYGLLELDKEKYQEQVIKIGVEKAK